MRSIILQRLCFVQTILQRSFAMIFDDLVFNKKKEVKIDKVEESLKFVDIYLNKSGFLAGTSYPTLADFSCLATFTTIEKSQLVSMNKYPVIRNWAEKMKKIARNYEIANEIGIRSFGKIFSKLDFVIKQGVTK